MRLHDDASGRYCALTRMISSITTSVSSTFFSTPAASVLVVSSVVITLSLSRIFPCDALRACSKFFSNVRSRTLNSPCSLMRSMRFWCMSGRSLFITSYRHWLCRPEGVTVKFTNVTRLQRSGVKCAVGSRVARNTLNDGEKSMSWSPSLIRMRPPCLRISRFSTGFNTGSMCSTSCTSSGQPKRRALSKFFMKDASRKLVCVIFLCAYCAIRNSDAWPDGSMTSGYRLNRLSMIAFSTHRSSCGRVWACHSMRSSGVLMYSTTDRPSLLLMPTSRMRSLHMPISMERNCWSKKPM
mmetsp:Transcript_1108/g.2654  ORF Transcript_1108/g.2654 Transcript_1108/m.2654 type:complete len:296 (-) Transcript_1108:1785-2672(-)